MGTRRQRSSVAVTAAAALLTAVVAVGLAGCQTAETDDRAPVQQRDRATTPDAPDTGGHGRE